MLSQSTGNIASVCKQRVNYFDFLRGLAILMVIGIHSYADGLMHFNLFLRQFLNCAVPIFLAISGYFIGSKSFQGENSYTNFLKKQIQRVYVPMLLWSLPWFVLELYRGGTLVSSIGMVIIGEMGMEIFYFIILIIQFYALTPVIQKVNKYANGGVRRIDHLDWHYAV